MDEDNDGGLCLSCNLCTRPLSTMYKTSCGHLFCLSCAESHFSRDPHCPVESCNIKLTQKHFTGPIDVGINSPESLESALYKNVFSSSLLQDIILNALNAIPALEIYLEMARAQRGRSEADAKYKNQRKSMKAMEKDYRNKLALMQQALNNADSHKHKLLNDVSYLQGKVDDLARKNKSMEQVLVKLRADGHNVPSFTPTPVATPPPQYNHQQQMPPLALPSPRSVSRGGHGGGGGGGGSSTGAAYYQQHPQQQHHHQQPPPYGRSLSPSPRLAARPHSYGGGGGHHGHMPETPSSTSGFRRGGSAGPQGIMLGGGGGGGGLASRLSPHRNAAVVTSSSSGHFGGGGGGYTRDPSPKPGYALPMRY